MPTPAELWQQRQRRVSAAAAAAVVAVWSRVSLSDPQASFLAALPDLLVAVVAGQLVAAGGAEDYVGAVLAEDGLTAAPVATVAARRFAGVASDGRPLAGLLAQPLVRALHLRAVGADDATALAGGRASLETMTRTEVFDTGRDAVSVAMALEPRIVGWERYVPSPACDRCVVLAGRVYRRSQGFQRHPGCDCSMRPVTDLRASDGTEQTPRALFDAMTPGQQDKAFGQTNAEVIRRGGDIGKVVNARRGMATAGSNWTTEGASSSGVPRRPSPGALLRFARTPEEFAVALERAGYLA